MSYAGEVVGNLIFPPISDKFGRKYFAYIAIAI